MKNKDIVFWIICSIWLISGTICYMIFNQVITINLIFIVLMTILIIIKYTNNKFNKWLEKHV